MAERSEEESSDSSVIMAESNNDENIVMEIEVVFSKTVSHSSCSTKEDEVCSSTLPSCPDINEPIDTESSQDEKSPKTRKFKSIALPNWLVKPHAKKSNEEGGFTKHFHGFHGNKRKMSRTNSAPKKLVSGGVKLEYQHCNTIAEGIEEGLTIDAENHRSRPKSPIFPGRQISEEGKEKHKGHIWRRRASLPAQVGKMFTDGIKVGDSSGHIPLTPEAPRKHFNPADKMEKDVLKTLIFGRPLLGITKSSSKATLNPEPHPPIVTAENSNNVEIDYLNNQKTEVTKARLQLHRLETPDVFYIPDFDEESDTAGRLDKKISVSAGELRTATKIDNEKLEIELIKTLIGQDLKNYLEDKTFMPDLCQKWCVDISQTIKNSVQNFKGNSYKVVAVVYIAAIRDNGIHAAVQCLWTPDQDCFATASYKNDSLYAFGSLMAIKYD